MIKKNNLYPSWLSYISFFLTGAIAASGASLLIYFNRQPVLHHAVILLVAGVVFMGKYLFGKRLPRPTPRGLTLAVLTLITLAWLMPQFLYQIRPWTYYLGGFAIWGVLLSMLAANVYKDFSPRDPGLFIAGYIMGILLGIEVLQYVLMVLSVVLAAGYLPAPAMGKWQKTAFFSWMLLMGVVWWQFRQPIVLFTEQPKYEDKVIFSADTQHQKLVVTQWKQDHWFFLDGLKVLSSIDEFMYYEPMVHVAFQAGSEIRNVLVIGAENGCLLREVLKYEEVEKIDVLSYDTLLCNIATHQPLFTEMNDRAYSHEKTTIIREDIIGYLSRGGKQYDAVFIDLPDPRSVETNQYYTLEFYKLLHPLLRENGIMVTQAGSPYFATKAFYSIGHTLENAGFHTLPLHNQILTIGEWGWFICSKNLSPEILKEKLMKSHELAVSTRWYNDEAGRLIASFGKTWTDTLHLQVNAISRPVVYKYYLQGSWDLR